MTYETPPIASTITGEGPSQEEHEQGRRSPSAPAITTVVRTATRSEGGGRGFPQFRNLPVELRLIIWRLAAMPGPTVHFLPFLDPDRARRAAASWQSAGEADRRSASYVRSCLMRAHAEAKYELVKLWRETESAAVRVGKHVGARRNYSALGMFDLERDVACCVFDYRAVPRPLTLNLDTEIQLERKEEPTDGEEEQEREKEKEDEDEEEEEVENVLDIWRREIKGKEKEQLRTKMINGSRGVTAATPTSPAGILLATPSCYGYGMSPYPSARHAAVLFRWDWGRNPGRCVSFEICVHCRRAHTCLGCQSRLCSYRLSSFAERFRSLKRFSLVVDEPHFPLADRPVVMERGEPAVKPEVFESGEPGGVYFELLDTRSKVSRARYTTPLQLLKQVQKDYTGRALIERADDPVLFRLLVRRDPLPHDYDDGDVP